MIFAAFNEVPVKVASGSCMNIGFGTEHEDPVDWKESAVNAIKKGTTNGVEARREKVICWKKQEIKEQSNIAS